MGKVEITCTQYRTCGYKARRGWVLTPSSLTLTGAVLKIQPHQDMDRDVAGQLVEIAAKLTASICDNIKSYSETEKAYFSPESSDEGVGDCCRTG